MAGAESPRRRCATYTRKSSDEGLEQDFNSLDAQREACEAYIRSQAGEGWTPVRRRYDDGGYSGGTLKRPALEQLLADIQAGEIDIVVVYKVDRLTRSLADFAKIVDVFDASEASFVSVTQQFNTTTSMGRLTLNMLLSFAQFEREVTGERIRDKIAASKRRGLWMGGPVPLGYEPDGRTLVTVEAEAETIRTLFRLYLELGTVRKVEEEARRLGLTTKLRGHEGPFVRGGRALSRGHLYHLLSNPLYIGRIPHNGDSYEGKHPAIIDRQTWEAVQEQLAAQATVRRGPTRRESRSLLQGKLFDEDGAGLTPTYTVKGGRRYRYYVSREPSSKARAGGARRSRWRLPAREIERLVVDRVAALMANPQELARLASDAQIDARRASALIERLRDPCGEPINFVQRVDLGVDEIAIHVDLSKLLDSEVAILRYAIPVCLRRRGVERRLILAGDHGGSVSAAVDSTLVRAVARGHKWFQALAAGHATSIDEIAEAEGVSAPYVARLLRLAFLAPDIVARILSGTQPVDLTAERLTKRIELPLSWQAQREVLRLD